MTLLAAAQQSNDWPGAIVGIVFIVCICAILIVMIKESR